jgi:RHS repeat-associated protein
MSAISGVSEQILSLPRGGGDVRGLGEKFTSDPHTGTGHYRIPIAVPEGRHGLTPAITLSYSTGVGMTPFGLGWSLYPPSLRRKLDKGIPTYDDELDTFVLEGSEDLVSIGNGEYRPRVETAFARIRHMRSSTEDHWIVVRPDGLRLAYGRDSSARVYDESTGRSRVASWHLSETQDACGNRVLYTYKADRTGVLGAPINQTYLKSVCYVEGDPGSFASEGTKWLYRILFDYGEGEGTGWDPDASPLDTAQPNEFLSFAETALPKSTVRPDSFSSFETGFEVRTLRRCWRISVQVWPDGASGYSTIRVYYLKYSQAPYTGLSLLAGVRCVGFRPEMADRSPAALPPLEFEYTQFDPQNRRYENLQATCGWMPDAGLTNPDVELVALFGNGLPDILDTASTGYRYWRNIGRLRLACPPQTMEFAPAQIALSDVGVQFADMEGNGAADILVTKGGQSGFYPNGGDGTWKPFCGYSVTPSFDLEDPDVRLLDLNGDHVVDALMTAEDYFVYYPNLGRSGWAMPQVIPRQRDLDAFPDVRFSAADRRVRLADMNGDGSQDIVTVYSGRVDYWPNVSHGHFGRRVSMLNSPAFDDFFEPERLFLNDVNGDGFADLVYVDVDRVRLWINQSGGSWSEQIVIFGTPPTVPAAVRIVDLNGTGTSGILWTYSQSLDTVDNFKYLDFTGGLKPHLLTEIDNGMGGISNIRYSPSTEDYVRDWEEQRPWRSTLPFPVHVVRSLTHLDEITGDKVVTSYRYHHGYFDGTEREYRGFGQVEEFDASPALQGDIEEPPPSVTRMWFHQGRSFDLTDEFHALAPAIVPDVPDEVQAHRALRGCVLRTEIYGLDGSSDSSRPYLVTTQGYRVTQAGHSWRPDLVERARHHFERESEARIIRNIYAYDQFGNVTRTDEIGEGRRGISSAAPAHLVSQSKALHRATELAYHYLDLPDPGWVDPYVPGYIVGRPAHEELLDISNGGRVVDKARYFYDGADFLGLGHPEAPSLPILSSAVARGELMGTLDLALTPDLEVAAWGSDSARVRSELSSGGTFYQSPDGSLWARMRRCRRGPDGMPEAYLDARGGQRTIQYDSHRLFPVVITDAAGFPTNVAYDYWAGAPLMVTDQNENVTHYAYDGLGRLVSVAYSGKVYTDGTCEGDAPELPTTEYAYDFETVPVSRTTRNRERSGEASAVHEVYSYFDGLGRLLEERVEAEPGRLDPEMPGSSFAMTRWVVTGKCVRNRKGSIRRAYVPFFSNSPITAVGQLMPNSPFTRFMYDALGRLVKTVQPDGGVSTVCFGGWHVEYADANDNGILASSAVQNPEYARFSQKYPLPPTAHVGTPQSTFFDPFGRIAATVEHNGSDSGGNPQRYVTRYSYNIVNARTETYDARDATSPAILYGYDLLGRQICIDHRAAGGRHIAAHDSAGNQIFTKDARGVVTTSTFDELQRPLEIRVDEVVREIYKYRAWNPADAEARTGNLFGRTETVYDGSGRVDFTYNLRGRVSAQLRKVWSFADVDGTSPDDARWRDQIVADPTDASPSDVASRYLRPSTWQPELSQYDSGFELEYEYDAYDRTRAVRYPDGSQLEIGFNQGNLPETLTVRRGSTTASLVVGVDYDAFGDTREIRFGNGVTSTYRRDPDNHRLVELRTERSATQIYQHIRYEYDPVGNIQRILDQLENSPSRHAQYIPNSHTYETDPLYRLTRASGRKRIESCAEPDKHIAHGAQDEWPLAAHAAAEAGLIAYDHRYDYDSVGNLQANSDYSSSQLVYKAGRPDLFAGDLSIASSTETPAVGRYRYDAAGQLVHCPRVHELFWDHDGCLTGASLLDGGEARFGYDAAALRVIKRVQRNGMSRKLTIYILDKWELTVERRPSLGAIAHWSAISHVWLDRKRLASLELGTFPNRIPTLYYHSDHVGSAHVLSREDGSFVGQEEFLPFGRTSDRRTAKNRYRFSGKERDEETGFYYFSGRYYDPVVGRFISPDPIAIHVPNASINDPQALSPYTYARNNPIIHTDRTGYILDTILDVGFIIYDVGTLVYDEVANDGLNRTENLIALGADAAGALIPVATGGGLAARAAYKAERMVATHGDDAARILTHADDASRMFNHTEDAARAATHTDNAARAITPATSPNRMHGPPAPVKEFGPPASASPSRSAGHAGGPGGGGHGGSGGSGGGGSGGGRGGKQFKGPDPSAEGAHSRFRKDNSGVTHYETYGHPTPSQGKRVDVVGPAHGGVSTPHVVETTRHANPSNPSKSRYTESRPRPARPDEIPTRK